MRSERDEMLAGGLYDPLDPDLVGRRVRARDRCQALNATREGETDQRRVIRRDLFGTGVDTVWMQPPFSGRAVWSPATFQPEYSQRATPAASFGRSRNERRSRR
jgi:hypothetical protein